MSYRIPKSKRELWDRAIYFIAMNDDPDCLKFREIRGYVSTICVAETFRVHTEMVARAVLKVRRHGTGGK